MAAGIAALTGVTGPESGVASGINIAAFQLGGAFGIAMVSTVAVARTAGTGLGGVVALAEGYRTAFGVAAGFTLFGALTALTLLGVRRLRPTERREPAATSVRD